MMIFAALADPTRRRIVEMLSRGALASGDIAAKFSISAPAVSQHLKVLKAAKLVRIEQDGQRRIYHVDLAGFSEMQTWLGTMEGFWRTRLDSLEHALKAAKKKQERT